MSYQSLTNQDLLSVQKPAQYLGGELNSILKNKAEINCHFALCFPDTYEVGMSHVGIQILYDIINRDSGSWAERAYFPFPDMEDLLVKKNIPLFSLESKTPLSYFDIIGFSLQYELCGTNVLGMLKLSNIPFLASERDDTHPIVIGGGPYSYHPESLSPFFDLFFLGDAEEFIPEVLEVTKQHTKKYGRHNNKNKLIEELSKLEGVYNPSEFIPKYKINAENLSELIEIERLNPKKQEIRRRLLPSLENAPFPEKPVVPNTSIVHNRLSVEVMRGCVRGCRFCQAGYLYRPQRERSPKEILKIIDNVLPNTGFEEVSLLSLSTADYCSIVPLLKTMMDKYGEGETLAISFPSTRVDALKPELLEQVQRVRRTNFTIAPEGGSQRLRDVINKGVSDEQILETCGNVFKMGWSGIKLYFMIGLPTETDDDLNGIIDLAKKIKSLPEGKNKDITVSVSTHVPKPHTPFQWAEQITPEETLRKHRILADGLKRAGVNFRYHDAFSTFLEGVFCRAGRELAPTIIKAYELGARLDAWQDYLNQNAWMQAFEETNIDPYFYLRERDENEILPWDHLSCDIPKSYFLKEYKRAIREKVTPDCLKTSCSICGACNYDTKKNILWPRHEIEEKLKIKYDQSSQGFEDRKHKVAAFAPAIKKLRVCYSKNSNIRFLGHLELNTVFQRAMRRANIPVCYSLGFHPLPKIAFATPLPLGLASDSEYFDIYLYENIEINNFITLVNSELPQGLNLILAKEVSLKSNSLQQDIIGTRYNVSFLSEPKGLFLNGLPNNNEISRLVLKRPAKKKNNKKKSIDKEFALIDHVCDTITAKNGMEFTLNLSQSVAAPSASEIVKAISDLDLSEVEIKKICTYFA